MAHTTLVCLPFRINVPKMEPETMLGALALRYLSEGTENQSTSPGILWDKAVSKRNLHIAKDYRTT